MSRDVSIGFLSAVALLCAFFSGAGLERDQIKSQCEKFGQFNDGRVVYDCKPRATKDKVPV